MKINVQDIWINRIGMIAIVIVSLGYVLFGSTFAQLRLECSFLNFPVFIGEILLGFTSLLFIVKSARQKWELGRWEWIWGAYFLFVLLKAFSGHLAWGPLAFRDAALFYYPFFIVLGYSFWSHDLWGDKTRWLALAVILSIFILHQFNSYWPCSVIIMGVILALQAKSLQERMILIGAIFLFAPYGALLNVFYRTIFLSLLITVIFIGVIFFYLFCKDRRVRIVGMVLGCLVLGTVLFKDSHTGMWSTYSIKDAKPSAAVLPQEPSRGKHIIKDAKPLTATLPQEPPRGEYLFHPVGSSPEKPDTIKEFSQRMREGDFFMEKKSAVEIDNEAIRIKKDDALFRYYIWRDMAFEYARYKPFFGFDFGRPLFSATLMKYFGISTTQNTDGWVGAHNSFLYMIYRAGIVGLAMVLFVFVLWFGLLRDFYILRDWTGILLCAVLLNWIVAANFFLIFELPYTAIPVWTILGVTVKHRMLLKK